jgi:hypothetical protein
MSTSGRGHGLREEAGPLIDLGGEPPATTATVVEKGMAGVLLTLNRRS